MSYDIVYGAVIDDNTCRNEVNRDRLKVQSSDKNKHVSLLLVLLFIMAIERVIDGYYFNLNHLEYSLNNTDSNVAAGFVTKWKNPNFRLFVAFSSSFLLPLMGGLLGDGILGRFKCALIGQIVHIGVSLVYMASLLVTHEIAIHALVYAADFLLVFCFGILMVNIQAMGANLVEASQLLQRSTYFALISTIQISFIAPGVHLILFKESKYVIVIHYIFIAIGGLCFFLLYLVRDYYSIIQIEPRRVLKVIRFIFCRCCPQKVAPLIQRNVVMNNSCQMEAHKFIKILPFLTLLIVYIVNVYFCKKFLTTKPTFEWLIICSPIACGLFYIFLTVKFDARLLVNFRIHIGIFLSTFCFVAAAISIILQLEMVALNTFIIFIMTFGQITVFSAGKEMLCVYLPTNMEAIAIGLYETSFGLSTVILYGIGMHSKSITSMHAFAGIVSMTAFVTFFQIVSLIYNRLKK